MADTLPNFNLTEEDLLKQSAYTTGKITTSLDNKVAVIHMQCGQNRINYTFLLRLVEALEEAQRNSNVKCVIIVGEGKFFSNGIDIEWFSYLNQKYGQSYITTMRSYISALWKQLLTYPMPTIAAINGHAFAGGGVLAMTCDYRIMRQDKGWFCLNEVHLGIQSANSTRILLQNRLSSGQIFNDVVVMGKRYTGVEALNAGIVVDTCFSGTDLLPKAKAFAVEITKNGGYDREHFRLMKEAVYKNIIEAFKTDAIGSGFEAKL